MSKFGIDVLKKKGFKEAAPFIVNGGEDRRKEKTDKPYKKREQGKNYNKPKKELVNDLDDDHPVKEDKESGYFVKTRPKTLDTISPTEIINAWVGHSDGDAVAVSKKDNYVALIAFINDKFGRDLLPIKFLPDYEALTNGQKLVRLAERLNADDKPRGKIALSSKRIKAKCEDIGDYLSAHECQAIIIDKNGDYYLQRNSGKASDNSKLEAEIEKMRNKAKWYENEIDKKVRIIYGLNEDLKNKDTLIDSLKKSDVEDEETSGFVDAMENTLVKQAIQLSIEDN